MLKAGSIPVIIFIVLLLYTCIDPYTPKLNGYESLLVVEGLITNERMPYEIKLSRTMGAVDSNPEKVTDAVVSITDETGKKTILKNSGNGSYKTDTASFIGEVGKTYVLNIATSDGKEFVSEPCVMLPVPDIDSIYYEKDKELFNNGTESLDGIRIYLDSKPGDLNTSYRWDYEETWKFRVPTPKKFNYFNEKSILPINNVKEFCWKDQKTKEILINSIYQGKESAFRKEPVTFISPEKSDRLTIQYSILVRQYSISQKEYEFWDNLKKVNEIGGDIFGVQPFSVVSNISGLNSNERVLGYFQVSAVKQKRKFITFTELKVLDLPLFHYDCVRYQTEPADYCRGGGYCIPPTWDELNKMWEDAEFTFVEPLYSDPITGKLGKLVFTRPECAICELSGTSTEPDFWIDLN
jgi:hypothetical protein